MGNIAYIYKRIITLVIGCIIIATQACVRQSHKSIEKADKKMDSPEIEYKVDKTDSIKKIIETHILTSDKSNLKFKPY
jgi:hypothetical protein